MATKKKTVRKAIIRVRDVKNVGPAGCKTDSFDVFVRDTGQKLGSILWHDQWCQYVFQPCARTSYSCGYLIYIMEFVQEQNDSSMPRSKFLAKIRGQNEHGDQ